MAYELPAPRSAPPARQAGRPGRLLRWGLPRDPSAMRHLSGFVVAAVATILVTRGLLAATGFPKLGGSSGLHVAHVLWGGLLLGLAMVLTLSFAGPVVRPLAALVGGVGFGLFIDEVGKFLTADNDYFYQPAPAVMYLVVVLLMLLGEAMHGRRAHHPAEYLAGAADYAVAGIAGGFTEGARENAQALLDKGRSAPGAAEVAALLRVVPDDPYELRDPIDLASGLLSRLTRRLAAQRWAIRTLVVLLVLSALLSLASGLFAVVDDTSRGNAPWSETASLASGLVSTALIAVGLVLLRGDRAAAFLWFRWAVLVDLLVTQVLVLGTDWLTGSFGVLLDLLLLVLISGEARRLEHEASGASGPGRNAVRP